MFVRGGLPTYQANFTIIWVHMKTLDFENSKYEDSNMTFFFMNNCKTLFSTILFNPSIIFGNFSNKKVVLCFQNPQY